MECMRLMGASERSGATGTFCDAEAHACAKIGAGPPGRGDGCVIVAAMVVPGAGGPSAEVAGRQERSCTASSVLLRMGAAGCWMDAATACRIDIPLCSWWKAASVDIVA